MDVELLWNRAQVGSTIVAEALLAVGAVVTVRVPEAAADEESISRAFRARAADGREFSLDVVKIMRDEHDADTSIITGYLRVAE